MTKSYRRIVDQELDKNAQPIIDVAREVIRALGIVVDGKGSIIWGSDNDQGDPPFYPKLDFGFRQAKRVELGPQVTENVKEALLKLSGFKVPEHVYSHSAWLQKGDVRIELPMYYPPDDTSVNQGLYGLEIYGPANVTIDLNKYFPTDHPEYGEDYSPTSGHDVDLK